MKTKKLYFIVSLSAVVLLLAACSATSETNLPDTDQQGGQLTNDAGPQNGRQGDGQGGPSDGAQPEGDKGGPPPSGDMAGGPQEGQGPDLAAAAEKLGITEEALRDALGPPPPDFAATAETLGITEEVLMDALGVPENQ